MTDSSIHDRYLEVAGARLRYRDEGRGPAIVFVHGWTLDLDMWDPQAAALSDSHRIVRFDRRGFGLSSGQPSLAHDIADLDELCGRLSLGEIALVGMSQGARAALGFAAAAPAHVRALVLDGPPDLHPEAGAGDVPVEEYRALVRTHGIDAFRRAWAMHPLMQPRTRDERAHDLLRSMIARYRALDLIEGAAGAAAISAWAFVESLSAPVLVITGEHDAASRVRAADALAARMPHAGRAVIPDAGHLANLDNPATYNRVIREFVDRHLAPPH